jgi:peptide/nickel transport system substrate-binding protein
VGREGEFVRRYTKLLALVAVLGIIATACAQDRGPQQPGDEDIQPGGTLELNLLGDVSAAFDPQKEYYSVTWEFYRCCLLRTLVGHTGTSTEEGGTELVPDLATDLPEVSDDGLTWTFTIQDGVRYSPPFEDVEITAEDFIRALRREADPEGSSGGYSFYYSVIEGFDEYTAGDADDISGITAVDDKTLQVTLTRETGDFGYRMAMHATAPIPPHPTDADAPFGAAEGHDKDYGRFLVASGPYMFEGSENLDFSKAPKQQDPVAGYEPGKSITMVRNPAWDPDTDENRPAYVDRIEISIGGTEEDNANQVDQGILDIQFDGVAPAQQVRQYQQDPNLKDQIFINPSDAVRYLSFNIAEPPFDDLNVRKAVNFALDKEGMRRIRGGPLVGEIANHIMVDSLQNNQLLDYNPYPSPNNQGDIAAAQEAMKASKYDTDGDGVCDDPVCKDVLSVTDEADPYPDQAALISSNLEPLGITLDIKSFERTTMYDKCNDIGAHTAFCMGPGWGKDYPDGTTFGEPLFGSGSIGPDACCNYALVGASADALEENGYTTTEVPTVDDMMAACDETPAGDERVQCWADVDTELMENVVPWVPYLFDNYVRTVSERVQNYVFDQFAGLPALEKIALAGGGAES